VKIEVRGAPADQGRAQGESLRAGARAALARLRSSHTALSWWAARRRAQRGPGRALARFLPWQAERLEGLAHGARLSGAALQLGERAWRVRGAGWASGAVLGASLDVPPELEDLLVLRASIPDAGGFASLELGCAHWASCLGGINSEGIAVICADDRARGEPSLRFLAQELLFRARDLDAGIEHLRRRARYTGGSGTLVAASAAGGARWLHFEEGALRAVPAPEGERPPQCTLALDCAARRLTWTRAPGVELDGAPPPTQEVRS
jgi:hypothetical protein